MGGASLRTLCLAGAFALLGKFLGTNSIGFSAAAPGGARNESNGASPGRPRMGSRKKNTAAGQSSTDYGLTKEESKLLAKVVQAANRSDWQRIRQLRATSKVLKTPFFDVEMNAALACGQYKAGTTLYEQLIMQASAAKRSSHIQPGHEALRKGWYVGICAASLEGSQAVLSLG